MSAPFDALIVGGGPAGLSAALMLGRARRRVLLLDSGEQRNRSSHRIGGFLTRDGCPPRALLRVARQQLRAYPTLELRDAVEIVSATPGTPGFQLCSRTGEIFLGRKLLIASGVTDSLPPIPDAERFYGCGVLHCPYCDAYEQRDKAIAVYGSSKEALALALELTGWTSRLCLLSNGVTQLRPAQRRRLAASGIALREERIIALKGRGRQLERIIFAEGEELAVGALFFHSEGQARLELARGLGLNIDHRKPLKTAGYGKTKVPGLYVAGDASNHVQFAIVAAAEGASAAFAINTELLKEDIAGLPRRRRTARPEALPAGNTR
ncbi:NAD(P)/FAD-dependent oxidoreductase [Bosea lathyri]|uniref:Thioredoxin reductase n=1 Tax=Bosea lathyri TaxID=1036778 RepID=A0A1H6D3A3_9HYPH|nr:NAD(P)/FAD-dependent oxidoreductase [Bosea lathyri]SEG79255.1 Thioredoxin reductase [Bosea lathyri]